MNFQPPDPSDYGHCPKCNTAIHFEELYGEGCIECALPDAHSTPQERGEPYDEAAESEWLSSQGPAE